MLVSGRCRTLLAAHSISISKQTLPFMTAFEALQHPFSSGQVYVHGFFSFPPSSLFPSLKFYVSFFKN
jgi:hypothetical protein